MTPTKAKAPASSDRKGFQGVKNQHLTEGINVSNSIEVAASRAKFKTPLWHTGAASKEVVLENTLFVARSSRPVSAASSCPNSVRFWGRWAYPRGWPHCGNQCFQHLPHPSLLENSLGS